MAFKVLLRCEAPSLVRALTDAFDEQPFTLIPLDATQWQDPDKLAAAAGASHNVVLVHLLLEAPSAEEVDTVAAAVALCEARKWPLVYFSSYEVFGNAETEGALPEERIPVPDSEAGRRWQTAESQVMNTAQHLIVRKSWLLSGARSSVFAQFLPSVLEGESVIVSDHHFGSPVSVPTITNAVLAMVQQIFCGAENWGVMHLHSSDVCSEAEFADTVSRMLRSLTGGKYAEPEVATRGDTRRLFQGNAYLTGRRITDDFGVQMRSWRSGLKAQIKQYIDSLEPVEP